MMFTIRSRLPLLMIWLARLHLCTMSATSFTGVRQQVSRSKSHSQNRQIGIAHLPQYITNDSCILHRNIDRFAHSMHGNLQQSPSDATNYILERELRFAGVARLYKDKVTSINSILDRLSSATVAIIGLGGVGSWSAESLCRSGIGNIILIDLDDICISNTNRQLHATSSNVGKMKIDVMKSRLLDINPHCNVTLMHDFVTMENANSILSSLLLNNLTACIDAIDGMYEKTALLLACVNLGIPIVTCGGAAGRMDPSKVVVDDLTKVKEDRLLFKCRKLLRQKYGFPKVPIASSASKSKSEGRVRNWRIQAVYSTEVQQRIVMTDDVVRKENESNNDVVANSSFRTCDGPLGTASFVTATYGLSAAWKVVEMIALDQLVVPKKLGRRSQQRTSSNTM